MFATVQNLVGSRGPLVVSVELSQCGLTFLIRRLDLLECSANGVWDQPITELVRRLMAMGGPPAATAGGGMTEREYVLVAKGLARAAVIIPPDDVAKGRRRIDTITVDECAPLFVGDDPGPGQAILMENEEYWALVASLNDQVATGAITPEGREERLAKVVTLQWEDLMDLAEAIRENQLGSLARFRRQPRNTAKSRTLEPLPLVLDGNLA